MTTAEPSRQIKITPRLGRLRVLDHCSFFWAEYRTHRVVQVQPGHCERCIEEIARDARDRGATVQLTRTDSKTSRVLDDLAESVDRGEA